MTRRGAGGSRACPFDAINAAKLRHQIARLLALQQRRLLHNLHNLWAASLTKAAPPKQKPTLPRAGFNRPGYGVTQKEIAAAVDDALDEPMTDHLVGEFARPIAAAGIAASNETVNSLGTLARISRFVTPRPGGISRAPFLPPIIGGPRAKPVRGEWDPRAIQLRTTTKAVDYAASRAAELVGKRYTVDGDLIDNPNAQWAINSTTRDTVQGLVRDAAALHWDTDKLATKLEDTGTFSAGRAEMIARTEISFAQNQGTLEAGRQARDASGQNIRKVWTLGDDPCPLCEDAAAEGDVDLEEDFGDAGDAPPLHPNCECELDLFVPDEDEDEEG